MMSCSIHFRGLLLLAALLLPGAVSVTAHSAPFQSNSQANSTEVHLRWGPRPGVSRYRLQLAGDLAFDDILFDRVISGNEYEIKDLSPGRYFWRIAPLTNRLGEFSSIEAIEVRKEVRNEVRKTFPESSTPRPAPTPVNSSSPNRLATAGPIVTRGGWRTAVGDISHPVLAHLRSSSTLDLVGVNTEGVVFALDASSGVALWSTGRRPADKARSGSGSSAVLLFRSRSGLDNLVVLSGLSVTAIEGASGRQLWQAVLPAVASSGTVISDDHSAELLLIDNSLSRLTILSANNGALLNQIKLPHRVVGAPVTLDTPGAGRVAFAYDTGQIEIRDLAGAVVRSGDAASPATTPPLLIRAGRGDFILVGTRRGLIALTADTLSPLGMVSIKEDAPRGTLAAGDLNGDGTSDVIMLTDRGRVVAVNAADGKTIWEATVGNEAQTIAFADVNGDHVLDVVLDGGQSFALALSGRDGSVVWKDSEVPGLAANHSNASAPRSIVAMSFGSGLLLIAADPSHTSLRALEFPMGAAPLKR